MPRLIDYASRFAFLREAAFQVVLTQGVHALSRRAVAKVQGVAASTVHRLVAADADLVVLAAEEVEQRRRRRWIRGTRHESEREVAVRMISDMVPDTDSRVAEELVWLRITLAALPAPADPAAAVDEGPLSQRYQVALRGWADPVRGHGTSAAPSAAPSSELTWHLAEHRKNVAAGLEAVARLLGVPAGDRETATLDLHLLVEGLTWATCTGRLRPEDAGAVVERAVDRTLGSTASHSSGSDDHHVGEVGDDLPPGLPRVG